MGKNKIKKRNSRLVATELGLLTSGIFPDG